MPNYYPATYQPYYYPQQTSTSMVWVGNEQEALNYPVAPNNAVPLWDSNNPVVYLKQADASGRPTIKIYDLRERTRMPEKSVSEEPSINTTYAEKSEITTINGEIEGLKTEFKALRKELNSMKRRKTEDDDE